MPGNCIVCGKQARQSLGGVLLCAIHSAAIRDQVDGIRASGGKVDVARLAYQMREPEQIGEYKPSAQAVHAYLKAQEITGAQAARMMYLSGSRQVRKYTGGQNPRQMDAARWFCIHAHTMLDNDVIAKIEAAMEADLNPT